MSPRQRRSTNPEAIRGAKYYDQRKAAAAAGAESFTSRAALSLYVMDPEFTRAFYARSLETGEEGVVVVRAPRGGN